MYVSALHAEWLKIRTLRSQLVALAAILLTTLAFSALAGLDASGDDPLFSAYFGVTFGQVAAVSFGTNAMAAEFRDGALRTSLAAVPDRTRWFTAKVTAIAVPVLAVGLLTGTVTLLTGDGVGWAEGIRGAVGCGIYLTLMALLAAGLTAVLRSGVTTLGIVVPFLLIVSFVVGDMSGTVADWFPDRAGQAVLHSEPAVDPWMGLLVTALWSAVALGAGVWRVRRRDA
ncbi:ABC transporter permease [Streptomyces acidiscabies]|uniref:ABC transporter permease n=1 Tax=Streptomyces acidiscabies TaxID=42234 RepID=A0AAP6BGE5_9ACTN|nr:ABC transporter permease [Streptomyces acidiscabies]MBP5941056.1 ABC transporter permease [Streptomyces sp. LBUM 1476]MBZ3912374.1 ABC transporter permease [Streptomyces acidiscabies]MDX2964150.1 ABC transporter permease [Streptomyces acidiscabies]MDX3021665.1 ABC transporter permease [Streptomyces acidiscabies]MDX3793932.1 ABC transporter permease [Streptomyces acidiscabies]